MTKTKKFKDEVQSVYPNEFIVLEEYKNRNTKIKVQHIECGDVYFVYPYDFLNKRYTKCKRCSQLECMFNKLDSFLYDKKLIEEYSYDKGNALYQYHKIEFTHKKCNSTFTREINLFYQTQKCPFCIGVRTNKNSAQRRIDDVTGGQDFEILNDVSDITAHDSKIKILHKECSRITETTLTYFLIQNPICHHCNRDKNAKIKRKTNEEFKLELIDVFGYEYIPLEDYITALSPIEVLHTPCGNILNLKPNAVLSFNSGCMFCNMSSPERLIDGVLKELGVTYTPQYRFKDCISAKNRTLPFDFVIFNGNEISLIVEYDGQHHFHEHSFGKESHERTVRNDNIKNTYCLENNLNLIRIPYTEQHRLKNIITELIEGLGNV